MARVHMAFGARRFEASWPLTLLTVAACVAFVALGRWQWNKGELREAQAEEFRRGSEQPLELGARALSEVERFQRVRVSGHYDPAHQFLLDNRTYDGRAGYEVLTPLDRRDGATILVDRGWIPFTGYRDRLPQVAFTPAPLDVVVGRVDELPSEGLESGRAPPDARAPWPKVTTYPHAAELSAALGRPTETRLLLLDPRLPNGYVREWQPPGLRAIRHWSYAVQWWAFAVLAVALWVILGFKKRRDG
ncbi:MAG TPA: SURF1 family protein [Steroidobacteraceae bacterium]|nr:SURF1 family protein [Steroidobacteraceae bacterium]